MLNKLRLRLRALFFKSKMEDELQAELQFHLERETEENIIRGMTSEEARSAAIRNFGGVERVKEESRDVRGVRLLEDVWQDLRYGARMLLKQPGFTLIAVITLALGIGANTAIFSVVNAVLLRPLPGDETGRLVVIWGKTPYSDKEGAGGDTIKEWRKQAQSFEQIEAGEGFPYTLTGVDPPESIQAAVVTAGYFSLHRAQAAVGRLFLPGEDSAGRDHVAVLDYDYWQRRFGGDPAMVGKTIKLNKEDYLVVGITPAGFRPLGGAPPFYLPLALEKYNNASFWVYARLKPGVTVGQANAEMAVISQRLQAADPKNYQDFVAYLVPLFELRVAQSRTVLLLLFGAVALVLLIACANVANLLLSRGAARRQEFAIRLALGASRARLTRQMMVESLTLALAGGGAGLLLALWIGSALGKVKWLGISRLDEVNVDWRALGFNLLGVIVTGLLCSVGPALVITRQDASRGLEAGGRGFAGSRTQNRTRHAVIVAEIALTFVLLYAAGLVTQSFVRMQRVDLGYDPHNILTFGITLPETSDPEGRQFIASYDRIAERIRRLPSVKYVGLTNLLPTGDGWNADMDIKVAGRPDPPNNSDARAKLRIVNADYFRALRIPLLEGRFFSERDSFDQPNVVIISQSLARRFFPDRSPLGERLMVVWLDPNMREGNEKLIPREIVGVVGDVKQLSVTDQGNMEMFLPYGQNGARYAMAAVRAEGDPLKLAPAIQREVAGEDKDLPIADVKTMEERTFWLTAQSQTSAMTFSVFAVLGLLLSAIGVYGVMSYAVAQRTHELGIRLALGAQRGGVLRLIILQCLQLAFAGLALGLAAALVLTRLLKNLLFGVSATDPSTFAVIGLLLVFVALLACWIPARRAANVDPMIALRSE